MSHRFAALAAVIAVVSLPMLGQAPSVKPAAAKAAYTPPKTPWGDPDLQGNWPASANIPMQRPGALNDKEFLSAEEFEQQKAEAAKRTAAVNAEWENRVTVNPPRYWTEGGKPHPQTSMVVDPPNGRVPPMTPAAQKIVKDQRGGLGPGQHFPDKVDSWEDFDYYSRCITRGFPSTMLPTIYNYGNDIIQAPGYVVIRSEMVHEQRVIPLDGRAHLGKAYTAYMGNSVGHWEGNTLVVETTNLKPHSGPGGHYTDAAKVVERFTRIAPDQLSYDATISDPNVWTKPWKIHYPFKMDAEYTVYEYACHEGNYMMLDALTAARKLEQRGLDTKVERGDAGGPPPGQR